MKTFVLWCCMYTCPIRKIFLQGNLNGACSVVVMKLFEKVLFLCMNKKQYSLSWLLCTQCSSK